MGALRLGFLLQGQTPPPPEPGHGLRSIDDALAAPPRLGPPRIPIAVGSPHTQRGRASVRILVGVEGICNRCAGLSLLVFFMLGVSASLNQGVASNSMQRTLSAVWQVAWIIGFFRSLWLLTCASMHFRVSRRCLAGELADLDALVSAPDIVTVAAAHHACHRRCGGDLLRRRSQLPSRPDHRRRAQRAGKRLFRTLAIDCAVDQIAAAERRLAADMLATGQSGPQAAEGWLAAHPERRASDVRSRRLLPAA